MKAKTKVTKKAAAKKAKPSSAPKPTSLVLRTCTAQLTSHSGFQWPSTIGEIVSAPDWNSQAECGNGLHGWLYGQGDGTCSSSINSADAKWLVVEVVSADIVMLGGKCKFPRCTVRHIGDKLSATTYLLEHEERSKTVTVIGATVTAGDSGTATAGDCGTATAGYRGTATAGDRGTATADHSGEIRMRYYDDKAERYRTAIAYVGEDGIKPNTKYKLSDANKFVVA